MYMYMHTYTSIHTHTHTVLSLISVSSALKMAPTGCSLNRGQSFSMEGPKKVEGGGHDFAPWSNGGGA